MPKRPTDKPKSRFKNRLAIILKQILSVSRWFIIIFAVNREDIVHSL